MKVIKYSLCVVIVMLMLSLTISVSSVDITKTSTEAASGTTGDCTWSFNETTGTFTVSGNGKMGDYINDTPWNYLKTQIKTVIIKAGVTSVGECAFQNCQAVTSVTIPNSVKTIVSAAFSGCKSLKSLIIPDSVTEIQNGAFYSCSSLSDIKIPNGITSIWSQTFEYCENLKSITIPKSVTSIRSNAFNECTNLKNVYYIGLKEDWSKITIGSNNTPLINATIHFGKRIQKITAKSYTKIYGAKAFNLKAKTSGNGKLSYKSSNKKVVTISSKGKVAIKGCGKATITIKASETSTYKAASKKIKITVKPTKVKIINLKGNSKKCIVYFKRHKTVSGYQCVYNGSKKKNVSSKVTSVTITNYKKGTWIKIRAYKKCGSKKIYGAYGKVKPIFS